MLSDVSSSVVAVVYGHKTIRRLDTASRARIRRQGYHCSGRPLRTVDTLHGQKIRRSCSVALVRQDIMLRDTLQLCLGT